MMTKYLNNPEYEYEKVNRASNACGPLVKWATAQVKIHLHLYLRIQSSLVHEILRIVPFTLLNEFKFRKNSRTIH